MDRAPCGRSGQRCSSALGVASGIGGCQCRGWHRLLSVGGTQWAVGLMRAAMSVAEIQQLPAVVDVVTAGRVLGLGRTKSYRLARDGGFPCRVIRVGRTYLVPMAELLALLGLPLGGDGVNARRSDG
jgi:hypothetical protein